MPGPYVQIHYNKKSKQPWHFTIIAGNGEVVATSENYVEHHDAVTGALSFLDHGIEVREPPAPE